MRASDGLEDCDSEASGGPGEFVRLGFLMGQEIAISEEFRSAKRVR